MANNAGDIIPGLYPKYERNCGICDLKTADKHRAFALLKKIQNMCKAYAVAGLQIMGYYCM